MGDILLVFRLIYFKHKVIHSERRHTERRRNEQVHELKHIHPLKCEQKPTTDSTGGDAMSRRRHTHLAYSQAFARVCARLMSL